MSRQRRGTSMTIAIRQMNILESGDTDRKLLK